MSGHIRKLMMRGAQQFLEKYSTHFQSGNNIYSGQYLIPGTPYLIILVLGPGFCGRTILLSVFSRSSIKSLLPGGLPVRSCCCSDLTSSALVFAFRNAPQSATLSRI
jgi:hypothetical protein